MDETLNYLKKYNNCNDFCGVPDTKEELDTCIAEIRETYGNNELCQEMDDAGCEIVNTEQFKRLLDYLVMFLKTL